MNWVQKMQLRWYRAKNEAIQRDIARELCIDARYPRASAEWDTALFWISQADDISAGALLFRNPDGTVATVQNTEESGLTLEKVREALARFVPQSYSPSVVWQWREPIQELPRPFDISDAVPDDTQLSWDEWDAKVDALLAEMGEQP